MDDDTLLGIGAFAVLSGMSITALQHYDEVHLLVPATPTPDAPCS